MENTSKKIGFRMVIGILAAVTILVAVFASGIQLPGIQAETGKLSIYLKDAPVEVDALWINMTELEVHKASDGEGEWISIDISDAILEIMGEELDYLEFDLLKYQNETVLVLANASVITGTYNKIRLTVTGAEAWSWNEEDIEFYNDEGYPVEAEGSEEISEAVKIRPLRVPPNRIDVIIDFTIETDAAVIVTIDMQPDWIAISHSDNLRPVMKATVEYIEVEE
jgi:hypothetical protein